MEKLDSTQLEQLKEIGAQLRQVRQQQSRSLEEIATKTCIRLPLLQAIENGQGQMLPEPVFVQGFIRRYAETLGLDGTSLSHTFPVNRGMITHREVPVRHAETEYAAAPVSTLEEPKYALPDQKSGWEERSPLQSKGAYLLYGLLALLTLGGIAYSFFRSGSPTQTATPPSPAPSTNSSPAPNIASSPAAPAAPSPASPVPPALPTAKASPAPIASPSGSPSSGVSGDTPVSANVRLTDTSWLQVVVDGRLDYEGTLPKGTERSWSAKREIIVVSGNAGAVSVSANDGASKPMGKLGDVQELTIKPKN
ncbi:helix-turn-helix domain-containing protein [Phormidium tenue FACHB-886]|nr:helix-turn-helix domain-containing protein [Phormidium tenue FACHB-886]